MRNSVQQPSRGTPPAELARSAEPGFTATWDERCETDARATYPALPPPLEMLADLDAHNTPLRFQIASGSLDTGFQPLSLAPTLLVRGGRDRRNGEC